MSRLTRLGTYGVGLGVWLSGAIWLAFHYFVAAPGRFGPMPDPLEPWWLRLHGAFAFAALWLLGSLSTVHVAREWRAGRKRPTGIALVGVLAWLILSGYLLYYVGDDSLRDSVSVLHWSIGLACPVLFAWHGWSAWRKRRRRAA
jgi:hypothetical protein